MVLYSARRRDESKTKRRTAWATALQQLAAVTTSLPHWRCNAVPNNGQIYFNNTARYCPTRPTWRRPHPVRQLEAAPGALAGGHDTAGARTVGVARQAAVGADGQTPAADL